MPIKGLKNNILRDKVQNNHIKNYGFCTVLEKAEGTREKCGSEKTLFPEEGLKRQGWEVRQAQKSVEKHLVLTRLMGLDLEMI